MKPLRLVTCAALVALSSQAFADEKSDAILKEVRLRAAYLKTYSVTIRPSKSPTEFMRIDLVQPDRLRVELLMGKGQRVLIVANGDKAQVEDKGVRNVVPVSELKGELSQFRSIAVGNLEGLIGKQTKSVYVTHKMLDETTVVDVIDVFGTKEGASARLYIDNNAQIRRIVGKSRNKSEGTLDFENPIADEPIPDEKFSVPDK